MYYYGIDLGTTYSCIARADDDGNVEVILNDVNSFTTPSVVEFIDANTFEVGITAKESLPINPNNISAFVKRDMGNPNFTFSAHGVEHTAEMISSYTLKKLLAYAKEMTGDKNITEAVITVPAYFGGDALKATELAGDYAGLTKVLGLIHEPTAAVYDYITRFPSSGKKTILVYDLGGGTFDVTIIEVEGDRIVEIATDGNPLLGGKDWDSKFIDNIIFMLERDYPECKDKIRDNPEWYNRLILESERTKKLFTSKRGTVRLPISMGQINTSYTITRKEFDDWTSGCLEETIRWTKKVIKQAAEKGVNKLDEIILVGGSTNMPQVAEELEKHFGIKPHSHDVDMAVARGAALYAKYIKTKSEEPERNNPNGTRPGNKTLTPSLITKITSKSYGVTCLDEDGELKIRNIIMKNTQIPCTKEEKFSPSEDYSDYVNEEVYESNFTEPFIELEQGKLLVSGSLPLPRGKANEIEIVDLLSIDDSGVLTVTATASKGSEREEITLNYETKTSSAEVVGKNKKITNKMNVVN